ncbi:MAG TPA: DUF6088 family protein [Planctomycetota bacterium]|nr:DUF6088 family protein [Planctomycetota bacterium]
MPRARETVHDRILKALRSKGPGAVVAIRDLIEVGDEPAIRQALSRAVRSGEIRRAARGMYTVPVRDRQIGPLSTTPEAVVHALQSRDGIRLLPSGAHAANLLGLSTQVPVQMVFLTDGPTRRIRLGKREIVLKRTTPRQMATAGRVSGTVIQALRWMGRDHIDEAMVQTLRRTLKVQDRKRLLADARYAPAWVGEVLRRVAAADSKGA